MNEPNHIYTAETAACWHCAKPTHWVEINFEARLCPDTCTDAKWAEYWAASAR